MKREELKRKLKQMRIPENLYNLDGIGRRDERFCLEEIDNKWFVYFIERGVKTTNERFNSEEDACLFIYEQLVE